MNCDFYLPGIKAVYYTTDQAYDYYFPTEDTVRLSKSPTGLTFYQIDAIEDEIKFKQNKKSDGKGTYYEKELQVTVNNFGAHLKNLESGDLTIILEDVNNIFYVFGFDQKATIDKDESENDDGSNEITYTIAEDSYYHLQYVSTTGITFFQDSTEVHYNFEPIVVNGFIQNAANVGSGTGLFYAKNGNVLQFKSIVGGSNVTVTPSGDTVVISSTGGGGSVTASTGLHVDSGVIKLGGPFEESIVLNSYSGGTLNFYVDVDGEYSNVYQSDTQYYVQLSSPLSGLDSQLYISPGQTSLQSNNFLLNLVANSATFTDSNTIKKGLQYAGDYSSSFTKRSLVDKAYVTGLTSSIVAGNGLTKAGSTIKLGGLLTDAITFVSGNSKILFFGIPDSKLSTFQVYAGGANILNSTFGAHVANLNVAGPLAKLDVADAGSTWLSEVYAGELTTVLSNHSSSGDTVLQLSGNGDAFISSTVSGWSGLRYDDDYSSDYTSRSLVDKGYVLSLVGTGATGLVSGATNGLTLTDRVIKLGGELTDGANIYSSSGATLQVTSSDNAGDNSSTLYVGPYHINLTSSDVPSSGNSSIYLANGTTSIQSNNFNLAFSTGSATFDDSNTTKKGLQYGGDYSSSFAKHSLVDKNYVTGITGFVTGATNGVFVVDNTLKLGGELTETVYFNSPVGYGMNLYGLSQFNSNCFYLDPSIYTIIDQNPTYIQITVEDIGGGVGSVYQFNYDGLYINGVLVGGGGYVTTSTYNTYVNTTAPATYANKAKFFTYTATTAPATYQSKSSIVTLTGTTLPATYQSKSSIATLTGTTLPATYASKSIFNSYTATTAPNTFSAKLATFKNAGISNYTVSNADSDSIIEFTGSTNRLLLIPSGLTSGLQFTVNNLMASNTVMVSGGTGTSLQLPGTILTNQYDGASIYIRSNNIRGFGNLS